MKWLDFIVTKRYPWLGLARSVQKDRPPWINVLSPVQHTISCNINMPPRFKGGLLMTFDQGCLEPSCSDDFNTQVTAILTSLMRYPESRFAFELCGVEIRKAFLPRSNHVGAFWAHASGKPSKHRKSKPSSKLLAGAICMHEKSEQYLKPHHTPFRFGL